MINISLRYSFKPYWLNNYLHKIVAKKLQYVGYIILIIGMTHVYSYILAEN